MRRFVRSWKRRWDGSPPAAAASNGNSAIQLAGTRSGPIPTLGLIESEDESVGARFRHRIRLDDCRVAEKIYRCDPPLAVSGFAERLHAAAWIS
jgi:hypothetical protein